MILQAINLSLSDFFVNIAAAWFASIFITGYFVERDANFYQELTFNIIYIILSLQISVILKLL
ncbi:hypothetical protein A3F34_01405 [Candidatus Roizmanbacteria bacterium RIFCSPHIGHO2_12_FULL_44_10]|uniref:Uncharacterized protein n=1 Tax=Candidatus Roizmanbacteria bacterium RIFCSPHIGHO2_12_FULL_44_10 TaxID=1802054 RepID=A0A1F7I6W4_9BACT|nr:MAG: hypothetical protein A3F34_01405 [Candidatus Roizmanbacteria bacterium RIFCSPHIGHO2_12_FULL_44_10]